jgi:solute carrier family 8 (sodium/calcium exchanger)
LKEHNVPPYRYMEIMRCLQMGPTEERKLKGKDSQEHKEKKSKIKAFMIQEYGREIPFEEIDEKDFKHRLNLDPLLPRIAARKKVGAAMTGKKQVLKGHRFVKSNVFAKNLKESDKNSTVGFEVLHYSASEAQGKVEINIIKKQKGAQPLTIGVRTKDGEAVEHEDYVPLNQLITFEKGKTSQRISIEIVDDDAWEPDENFYVELYDPKTDQRLQGEDTRTTITIIDDDQPGNLQFSKRLMPVLSTHTEVEVSVIRSNGNDGVITVQYTLEEEDGAENKNMAVKGEDFENRDGSITFNHQQSKAVIPIKLFPNGKPRDGIYFYVRLSRPHPHVVKVNSKDNGRCRVEIVADETALKKSKAEMQLLEAVQRAEEPTVADQLKDACMLYPTKNEDGVIEDVSAGDAIFHFMAIGWKVLFAFIPPKHKGGGWVCFSVSLCFIGMVTAIVGEVATLFGCVIGLKPSVTAITFVALGTSLPDTFASKMAAEDDKYADAAVGNVTGSNSVNVFLGLGLPWCIGALYSLANDEDYKVPEGALSFSVMLFLITSITCIIIICIRRCVYGGELGGPKGNKIVCAIFMCTLWFVYVIFSSLKAYDDI